MSVAYVGIGTNMGDRLDNINAGIDALKLLPNTSVIDVSNIYETKPWGLLDQPNFLNGVIKVETDFSPRAFLGALLGIEAAMGRIRTIKNGPRVLDLDLLLFDNEIINSKELTLPHPFICQREFVLKPLTELNDDSQFLEALNKLDQGAVWIYEP